MSCRYSRKRRGNKAVLSRPEQPAASLLGSWPAAGWLALAGWTASHTDIMLTPLSDSHYLLLLPPLARPLALLPFLFLSLASSRPLSPSLSLPPPT